MPLLPYLDSVVQRKNLSADDSEQAMMAILSGEPSVALIAAFLIALKMKGETADEVYGFAKAMRQRVVHVDVDLQGERLLDTCGTGGDGSHTFNISTVTAFVVAGAGVRVAKHGNRSISSLFGSADLLEALGVNIAIEPSQMAQSIKEVGIGFLFAPALHPAMRHAQPARRELKLRTVFNILGPLANPAGATAQLIGAPNMQAAELMAGALSRLDLEHGFVVHGSDGLDEITTTGPTSVFEVKPGIVERHEWKPSDFGLPVAEASRLKGSGLEENTSIARAILCGEKGPCRDIVLANAAAALVVAGKTDSLLEGVRLAETAIDSGAALGKLEALVRFTQSCNFSE